MKKGSKKNSFIAVGVDEKRGYLWKEMDEAVEYHIATARGYVSDDCVYDDAGNVLFYRGEVKKFRTLGLARIYVRLELSCEYEIRDEHGNVFS